MPVYPDSLRLIKKGTTFESLKLPELHKISTTMHHALSMIEQSDNFLMAIKIELHLDYYQIIFTHSSNVTMQDTENLLNFTHNLKEIIQLKKQTASEAVKSKPASAEIELTDFTALPIQCPTPPIYSILCTSLEQSWPISSPDSSPFDLEKSEFPTPNSCISQELSPLRENSPLEALHTPSLQSITTQTSKESDEYNLPTQINPKDLPLCAQALCPLSSYQPMTGQIDEKALARLPLPIPSSTLICFPLCGSLLYSCYYPNHW